MEGVGGLALRPLHPSRPLRPYKLLRTYLVPLDASPRAQDGRDPAPETPGVGRRGAPPRQTGHDIVVIGASTGGLDALKALVGGLPADLPAAVLVVLHTAASSPGLLGQILDRHGPLPARLARDGEPIEMERIYVAPPDRHLLVTPGAVRLSDGVRENRTRPAVDPLFRSAAVAYRSRVVGVVLTGALDDGAAGLRAVERCGGVAVVQDPADALVSDMPRHALRAVPDARRASAAGLGPLLGRLVREPAPAPPPLPDDLAAEDRLTRRGLAPLPNDPMDEMDTLDGLGDRVPLSCPDCGGALWHLHDEPPRYRCHVGHAYSAASLIDGQADATEQALVVALRTLEERARTLQRMAAEDRQRGRSGGGAEYASRAAELEGHADTLRGVLTATRP